MEPRIPDPDKSERTVLQSPQCQAKGYNTVVRYPTFNLALEFSNHFITTEEEHGFFSPLLRKPSYHKDYDPYDYGNPENPTSFWGTVSHLIILSFGPAVLTLPRSFVDAGYILGFIITLVIIYLYAYNMHMLVWSEYKLCKLKRVPNMSYSEVLYYSLKEGPRWLQWGAPFARIFTHFVFIMIWLGCTAMAVVLISENVQVIYHNLYGTHLAIRSVMLWLVIPLWLMCCIRKLSYLEPFSVAATILNLVCVAVVAYYTCFGPWAWRSIPKFGPIENVPVIAGTVLFNLTATGIIMPLKNEMRNPRKFDSVFGVLTVSYVPVSFLYSFLGLFCSLKYGDGLRPSVIQNLPADDFLAQLIIILSTLTSVFVYPLASYVVFDVIWNNIMRDVRENLRCSLLWEYILRTVIVATSFVGAFTVPNISLFLSLSGTVGTSIDSIIFPALMQTLVMWRVGKNTGRFRVTFFKNTIIMAIAVVVMVAGVISCVTDIMKYYRREVA